MKNDPVLKPVDNSERVQVLDALRGFAILGILMINILVFSGYLYMMADEQNRLLLADWNTLFDRFHTVFFRGKFYTLFSLLFGIGFAIQLIRASSAGRSFTLHFSRRLFFLLLIGVVHVWGIWFGDILVLYAVCGFLLILFKDMPGRGLLWTSFFLLLIPGLNAWYIQATYGGYTTYLYQWLTDNWNSLGLPTYSDEYEPFRIYDIVAVIQSDSWRTVLSFNFIGPILKTYIIALDGRFFNVLGLFVIGLWAGQQLLLNKIHENRPFLIRVATVGLLLGIPLNIFLAMENPPGLDDVWFTLTKETLRTFRFLILTAGYVATFMLLFRTRFQKILNSLFSAAGKTALSNYILQSLICIFLLYDAGLGFGKYMGSALLTLTVIIIFAIQIVISTLWLKRYRFGPLEWIWRVLTYGRYMKNRLPS